MMLKPGDPVIITYEGKTVHGFVRLASGNGRSLVLGFEATLGGFVGMMAISVEDDGRAIDLFMRKPVTIRPVANYSLGGD